MTDPVDTDALRDMGAVLTNEGHAFGSRITAAADEVDRLRAELGTQQRVNADLKRAADAFLDEDDQLRAVIENAPHSPPCVHYAATWQTIGEPCTCWKAEVL